MFDPYIALSMRLRRTPFSRRVEAAGARSYTVYNHMLLPKLFQSVEEDYAHLKSAVQVWDVSCERQVEISGPDALRLVQMATPRDITGMAFDQCFYIPAVDARGRMLNDPVLVKLADDRYWVSLADSDLLLYYHGLATGLGLDVDVFEPDVSPLAVQGPKADELIGRVFGRDVVDLGFFRHRTIHFRGKGMIIARSGYSKQGGFEIYLDGSEHGEALWDTLFEAGEDLDVRAGGPNAIEIAESGLLSYGIDITMDHTPFEAGLGKYCDLDTASGCVARDALRAQLHPRRQIRAIEIDGPPVPRMQDYWPLEDRCAMAAGLISTAVWSPDFKTNVATGMVCREAWEPGTELLVHTPSGIRESRVREKFWY